MIDVAVYNREGKELESLQVDEGVFGGVVRYPLLKQAIVMYHANKRVGTAATKSRGMVQGSTRKLFKQKATGNARVGNARTG
ncbi:MAG: 50S ribosomal protein L4, partial [Planctomycetes bacterium]|nr:50S ribosomal protein L4 [Planctomycetota bacterium]